MGRKGRNQEEEGMSQANAKAKRKPQLTEGEKRVALAACTWVSSQTVYEEDKEHLFEVCVKARSKAGKGYHGQ